MDIKDELSNLNSFDAVKEMIQSITDQNKKALEPITHSINILQEQINNSIKMSIAPALKAIDLNMSSLSLVLKDLHKNPEGVLNFFEYMHKLDAYYWSMPFEMNGETLNSIIQSSPSEKLFDTNMSRYFSRKRMDELFEKTHAILPRNKKVIYNQIQKAFDDKSYQLINGPIISLIDDSLSTFLVKKSNTSRKGILLPILEDLEESVDWYLYVFLNMLSNNITSIFKNIDFDEDIVIVNNKKISRHTIHHGRFLGNNKRIESIMLLNTLYNSLVVVNQLNKYHNKISFERNKGFILVNQNI